LTELQRTIVFGLSCFLDKKFKFSESDNWRKISRWSGWDIFGNHAENVNSKGFLSDLARKNPKDDFIYSTGFFFVPKDYRNREEAFINQQNFKYIFIKNVFKSHPDPEMKLFNEKYKTWINPDEVEHLELLLASPSYASIASIAGHLSLLIKRKRDVGGLSTVVSFVANNINPEGLVDGGCSYVLKGILGTYKSMILEETLLDVINRQTIREDRDIYRLKLVLNREQIRMIIQRLWAMKTNFNYKYFFFNKNCTTMFLNLLNFVLPVDKKIQDQDMIDLPLNIVNKIFKNKRADFIYPEYWSLSRNSRFSFQRNKIIIKEIFDHFKRHLNRNDSEVLKNLLGKLMQVKVKNRQSYYLKLYGLYLSILNRSFDHAPIPGHILSKIGSLLLELFFNAKDFEKYLFYKGRSFPLESETEGESIIKSDNKLYELEEIKVLMQNILNLRYILKNRFQVDVKKLYSKVEDDRSTQVRNERNKSGYGCGYSTISVTPKYFYHAEDNYLSLSLNLSTFSQAMGDKSVFSMGPGTEIDLLNMKLTLSGRGDQMFNWKRGSGLLFDRDFTLLNFKKVFQKNRVKYTGTMNSGFSVLLFSQSSDKLMKFKNKLTFFNLGYILNIYERNDFMNFLNLELGLGLYSIKHSYLNKKYYYNTFVKICGKFHLFKKYPNVLRYSFSYSPKFSIKDRNINFSQLSSKIGVDLLLNTNQDVIFAFGLDFQKYIFGRGWGLPDYDNYSVSVFSTLRFHGKLIPSINLLRKPLNKIF
jgi:hypothetical protein